MNKKGQLTLFIFMAIVIVIAIVGYYLFDFESVEIQGIDSEARAVYEATEFCMQDVTAKAIIDLGISGGYFDLPTKSNELNIPYYFYEGENLIPSIQTIENELAKYVEQMATICIKKAYFNLPEYEVVTSEMVVDTKILSDDTISYKINYPFTVKRGENSYYINKEFSYSYDVRFYTIYNFVSGIIKEHEIEPRALCINCAGNSAYLNNLFLDTWEFKPSEVIYYVSDKKSFVNNEEFVFFFVIKYPENNNYDPYENF